MSNQPAKNMSTRCQAAIALGLKSIWNWLFYWRFECWGRNDPSNALKTKKAKTFPSSKLRSLRTVPSHMGQEWWAQNFRTTTPLLTYKSCSHGTLTTQQGQPPAHLLAGVFSSPASLPSLIQRWRLDPASQSVCSWDLSNPRTTVISMRASSVSGLMTSQLPPLHWPPSAPIHSVATLRPSSPHWTTPGWTSWGQVPLSDHSSPPPGLLTPSSCLVASSTLWEPWG